MARPRIYNADDLAVKLEAYIDDTPEPLIQEFCVNEDISRDTLYRLEKENKPLSDNIKKALEKQEAYLLRNASTGKINPVFTIFRLKQPAFGYTDRGELSITAQALPPDPAELQAQLRALMADLTPEEKQLISG